MQSDASAAAQGNTAEQVTITLLLKRLLAVVAAYDHQRVGRGANQQHFLDRVVVMLADLGVRVTLAASVVTVVSQAIFMLVNANRERRDPACAKASLIECRKAGAVGSCPLDREGARQREIGVFQRFTAGGEADAAASA
ncbi:hypothetical protein D3C80_1741100 [compost metagenome]